MKSQPSLEYLTNLPSFTQQKITQMKASWSPLSGVASLSAKLAEALASEQLFLSRKGGRVNHGWKNIILTICAILLFAFVSATPAHAQTFNLSISPPLLTATIKPGNSFTKAFTLKNNSSTPVTLTARLVPFTPGDSLGHPSLLPNHKPSWLNYFKTINTNLHLNQPFTLNPNQSEQIVLSLQIPPAAAYQDIYAALLVQSSSPNTPQGSALSGSLGANLLISIADQAFPVTQLQITDFTPTTPPLLKLSSYYIYDSSTPLNIQAKLANTGRHKTTVSGRLQLLKGNAPTHTTPLLPINLLAQSSRTMLASPSGQPRLTIPARLTRIGKFKLHLLAKSPHQHLTSDLNIFFFPIKTTLAILVLTTTAYLIYQKSSTEGAQTPLSDERGESTKPGVAEGAQTS